MSALVLGRLPFGVSFGLGISFGGVTGEPGVAGVAGAVPNGDAAQQPGVGSQQEVDCFRWPSRARRRSSRLGFSQQAWVGHAGAGSQQDEDRETESDQARGMRPERTVQRSTRIARRPAGARLVTHSSTRQVRDGRRGSTSPGSRVPRRRTASP